MNKELSKIVQIRNYASKYSPIPLSSENYSYKYLTSFNHEEDINTILKSIYKTLPDWSNAPTIEDVHKRFDVGSSLILQYYNGKISGWFWGCPYYADDYYTKINDLPKGVVYCGSTYVIKDVASRIAGAHLYSYSIGFYLEKYDCIYSWMDDWNIAPIKLCIKCGGEINEWISCLSDI